MVVQLKEINFESPLSEEELTEKLWLERKIERVLHGEAEKWRALRDIVEKRLYRPLTKEQYCKTRWGFSEDAGELRVFAAKLVDAIEEKSTSSVSTAVPDVKYGSGELPTFGRVLPIPDKLDQLRAYRGLPIETSVELYSQGVKENDGFPPSRAIASNIVKQYKNSQYSSPVLKYHPLMIVKVETKNTENKSCYCRISSINRTTLTVWQRNMTTNELILQRFSLDQVTCPIEDVEDEIMCRIALIEETGKCHPIYVDICTLLKRAVFLTPAEEDILQKIEISVGLRNTEPAIISVPVLDKTIILPLLRLANNLKPQLVRSRSYQEVQSLFLDIQNQEERELVKQFVWELLTPDEKENINRLKIPFRNGERVLYFSQVYIVEIEGQVYTKLDSVAMPIHNSFLSNAN